MRLDITEFDIGHMLRSVLSLVDEKAHEYDVTIDLECPKGIGRMLGDETRLKQALFNLLSNALKYSPKGGAVSFGVKTGSSDGEILEFWVEDQGVGIESSEQSAIFDTFYQGGHNTAGRKSGTGLGLSMVKSFIQLHGGRIELASRLDVGTRVMCHLPRRYAHGLEGDAGAVPQEVSVH